MMEHKHDSKKEHKGLGGRYRRHDGRRLKLKETAPPTQRANRQ